VATVRPNDGQQGAIFAVISAMPATLVEEHKAFVAEQRADLREPNASGRRMHPFNQFITPADRGSLSVRRLAVPHG
jgi:hypothetical protein